MNCTGTEPSTLYFGESVGSSAAEYSKEDGLLPIFQEADITGFVLKAGYFIKAQTNLPFNPCQKSQGIFVNLHCSVTNLPTATSSNQPISVKV